MSDTNQKLIDKAKANGQKWLDNFRPNGQPDMDVITSVLNARTFNGEPVTAVVVKSPGEATAVIKQYITKHVPKDKQEEIISNVHNCIWDYYYMAFYESACSILEDKDFPQAEFIYQSLLPAFTAGLGWIVNLGGFIVGICLPEAHQDDQSLIHKETGPAIIWGDDKQYWWHGVQIPGEWIEDKDNVDLSLCITWENVEQRRALCEIIGWDKVLDQLKAKLVDKDEFGELLSVDLPDASDSKFIKVTCGTGRTFALPVPQDMRTAHQAVAWTYNIDITNYSPEVRT